MAPYRVSGIARLADLMGDTRWRSWFRHCATSRKVAVSIPDGVTGIFHCHNPSRRTEMSTRIIFLGAKAAGV